MQQRLIQIQYAEESTFCIHNLQAINVEAIYAGQCHIIGVATDISLDGEQKSA